MATRIAVCESNPNELERLQRIITVYPAPNDVALFSSTQELLTTYETGARHDMIFLGIHAENRDCFSAAITLRETYAPERPLIIYVAAMDHFPYQVLHLAVPL